MNNDDGSCRGETALKPLTILIIDDADSIVEVLAEGLRDAGYRVIAALGGRQGLDLFSANHVDVILSDLCMPDVNGLDVARAIRELCAKRGVKKPPVILVTGWAGRISGDHRISQAGVDAVIGKPVVMQELVRLIHAALLRDCE
jgi:two-component system, sensor histidine kinase